jgi:hypothetical protein
MRKAGLDLPRSGYAARMRDAMRTEAACFSGNHSRLAHLGGSGGNLPLGRKISKRSSKRV